VLCAIFVYDITVKTGKFEEVRRTIAGGWPSTAASSCC